MMALLTMKYKQICNDKIGMINVFHISLCQSEWIIKNIILSKLNSGVLVLK